MPDVEKAREILRRGMCGDILDCPKAMKAALSALTEEKPPEPEVWTIESGRPINDEASQVLDADGHSLTRWLPTAKAQRIARLPTLEREHAELVRVAKRVVEKHAAIIGFVPDSPSYLKARKELNTAVNELGALVEPKP